MLHILEQSEIWLPEISWKIHKKHWSESIKQARSLKANFDIWKLASWRRSVIGITIDGLASPDLDDGIHCEKISGDRWYLIQVSIASPTEMIDLDSPIDKEALLRATSVYFGEKHIYHMLPNIISTDMASLNHQQHRLTLTLELEINNDFEVVRRDIFPSIFFNKERHHPLSFMRWLANTASEDYENFSVMHELARWLRQKRENDIRIKDFDDADRRISMGEKIEWHDNKHISSFIIQEFMILANVETSIYQVQESINGVFRNHMPEYSDGRELPHRLERAEYGSEPKYHTGLGLPKYGHFTSPIRRYADYILHRQLVAHLWNKSAIYSKEDIENICQYINRQITAIVQSQKEEMWDRKGKSILRTVKKNGEARTPLIEHLKLRNQRWLRVPASIRENILETLLDNSLWNDDWIIKSFFFSDEPDIQNAIAKKIQEDTKVSRYIGILKTTGKVDFLEEERYEWNTFIYTLRLVLNGKVTKVFKEHQQVKVENTQEIKSSPSLQKKELTIRQRSIIVHKARKEALLELCYIITRKK